MTTNAQKLADAERILDTAAGELYTLQAENEGLRAALKHIKTVCDDNANVSLRGRAMALKFVRDIAASAT